MKVTGLINLVLQHDDAYVIVELQGEIIATSGGDLHGSVLGDLDLDAVSVS
jgi:hypothetical protein